MNAQPQSQELLGFVKALGDAERLKIVSLLANEALTEAELADKLAHSPEEIGGHLAHLESLGLVQKAEDRYQLNTNALEGRVRTVLSQIRPRTRKEDFEGDDYERKVLADYFSPEGRLKSIPSQHKKLMVVLAYLVKQFEADRRYPEKQVNEILGRFHRDFAALRRYLIDNRLMAREKGEYWRLI